MKTKKITCALIVMAAALCVVFFIIQKTHKPQSLLHTIPAPFASSSNQAHAFKNDTNKTTFSLEQVLHKIASHQQEGPVNQEALHELKNLVLKTQRQYDAVFTTYQDAISSYEQMSADFDAKLRDQAQAEVLEEIDQQRLVKAQEILQLKQSLNKAYLELMAKYDETIPHLMAKHFARPN